MSSQSPSQAQLLKAEGNALFLKNNLAGAYKKYTEALKYDEENAILYSNRAACSLGMKRYMDAHADAKKATDIDPGYARAWGRFATTKMGLDKFDEAIDAWTRALDVLPKENLTPAEQKQKDQYSSELAVAKAKFKDLGVNPKQPEGLTTIPLSEREKLPWNKALALIPELNASGTWNSSAWVIGRAYTTWEEAIDGMNQGHMRQTPAGPVFTGRLGVVAVLTNALIEDIRVFHMVDGNFASKYNQQMRLEASTVNAWSDSCSREVIQEAPKRLEAEGWESVRPALSTTVRGWMMRAFLEYAFDGNIEITVDLYTSAIEVLKWGAEIWRDVSSDEKGAVFQPTFMRGVKCLRLDALMKACQVLPDKYPHEELLASADEILSELADAPTEPQVPDPAFFLSFFRYPIGQAHAVRGFSLLENARRSRSANDGGMTEEITTQYLKASAEYLKAATAYPMDDKNCAWFLHCAYHAQFDGGSTPRYMLSILDKLKESMQMVKSIWEFSLDGPQLKELEADLRAGESIQRALDDKRMELDSIIYHPQPSDRVADEQPPIFFLPS